MEIKYDKIGVGYDLTRKADKDLTERFFQYLNPTKSGLYLDIGCGTGNYTNELHNKGLDFIGIDPSTEMLDKARKKNDRINWRIGIAEKTGLASESVNGVITSLTIHHWADLEQGFKEMYRILKNEGNIVIFTTTPEQTKGYWLNHYFPKMIKDSVEQLPSYNRVKHLLLSAGFQLIRTDTYSVKPDLQDLFLYSGKHNPELYFKKEIRAGISSFSSLANKDEVNKGLVELRKDIDTSKVEQIIRSHENNLGDYLFIIGKKAAHNKDS